MKHRDLHLEQIDVTSFLKNKFPGIQVKGNTDHLQVSDPIYLFTIIDTLVDKREIDLIELDSDENGLGYRLRSGKRWTKKELKKWMGYLLGREDLNADVSGYLIQVRAAVERLGGSIELKPGEQAQETRVILWFPWNIESDHDSRIIH